MNPEALLRKYFAGNDTGFAIVSEHSSLVAARAVAIAERLGLPRPRIEFVRQAALLHDIGVTDTDSPGLGCRGKYPYMVHGIIGREILEKEGWPEHALVCERHIGVGLTAGDIRSQNLPLPERDMIPVTLEERIVSYADLFYSKKRGRTGNTMADEDVIANLGKFGEEKVATFLRWREEFEGESD